MRRQKTNLTQKHLIASDVQTTLQRTVAPGNKPVSIPLTKVLSYNCYNNGIEVYKEGREKGYFFSVKDSGAVELFGICLGFLLAAERSSRIGELYAESVIAAAPTTSSFACGVRTVLGVEK